MNRLLTTTRYETVQRCIARCKATHQRAYSEYPSEFDREDILTVNLIRIAESVIDMARHMNVSEGLGLSTGARTLFRGLSDALEITQAEADELANMVSFRNLAVHEYAKIQSEIVDKIITNMLDLPLKVAYKINARAHQD